MSCIRDVAVRMRVKIIERTESEMMLRINRIPHIVVLIQALERYSAGGMDFRAIKTISTMLKTIFRQVMAIWRPAAAVKRPSY